MRAARLAGSQAASINKPSSSAVVVATDRREIETSCASRDTKGCAIAAKQPAKRGAGKPEPTRLTNDHTKNAALGGTDCHSQADLLPTLTDRKRDEAVKTKHRQQDPREGKHGEQTEVEPPRS